MTLSPSIDGGRVLLFPRSHAITKAPWSTWTFTIASLLFLLNFAANVASFLTPTGLIPPLPDISLALVPEYRGFWIKDSCAMTAFFVTMAYILLWDTRPHLTVSFLAIKFGIAILLRSYHQTYCTSSIVDRNFATSFVNDRCGDCMFSGHTAFLTIIILYWLTYKEVPSRVAARLIPLLTMLNALFYWGILWAIMANRTHYSMDMLVATYAVVGLWFTWDFWWERLVCESRPHLFKDLRTKQYAPII